VWRFQLGDSWGGYEYLDDEGYLQGFHPDLVKAVCAYAGKNCWWTVDSMKNCWSSSKGVELPGQGLMGGWYDGCVGLYPTAERQNSFDFSKAWSTKYGGALYYRRGRDGKNRAADDLTGKKIGILDGWAIGRKCIERVDTLKGNNAGEYEAVFYNSPDLLEQELLKNKIDAFVMGAGYRPKSDKIMRKGPYLDCVSDGVAVMFKYGSRVKNWWNEAMEGMIESGEFGELCREAQRKHGHKGPIDCVY
jgi:ABC-type amino acid transport substrate-binding protein